MTGSPGTGSADSKARSTVDDLRWFKAQDLIPRLPDDVAANCLQRVDYESLFLLSSVCRRRLASLAQPPLAFYVSDWPDICNMGSGLWRRLPPIPTNARWPVLYRIAGAGHRIATVGCCTDGSFVPFVHVYDLLTNTWRSGAACHQLQQSVSTCASDGVGRVFVAGGIAGSRTVGYAMLYDVDEDRWEMLPYMAQARGCCQGSSTCQAVSEAWRRTSLGEPSPGFALDASNGNLYHVQVDKLELLVKEGKNGRLACNLPPEFERCTCLLHLERRLCAWQSI